MKAFKYTAEDIFDEVVCEIVYHAEELGDTDGITEHCSFDVELKDGLRYYVIEIIMSARMEWRYTRHVYPGSFFVPVEAKCIAADIEVTDYILDNIEDADTDENAQLVSLVNEVCTKDFFSEVSREASYRILGKVIS